MVDDKMLCGLLYNKKHQTDLLMVGIGETAYAQVIDRESCRPMDFTGCPMRGYAFVTPDGYDADDELSEWINLCLAFTTPCQIE